MSLYIISSFEGRKLSLLPIYVITSNRGPGRQVPQKVCFTDDYAVLYIFVSLEQHLDGDSLALSSFSGVL